MEYIDSTATDKVLTVKYFLATCDRTGKSMLKFFQNGFPTSTPTGHTNIMTNFACDMVCGTKKKEKISLGKI